LFISSVRGCPIETPAKDVGEGLPTPAPGFQKEETIVNPRQKALAEAATKGQRAALEALLESFINEELDINVKVKDGKTILMLAAEEGRVDTVKALIRKGVDVNIKEEKHGRTALLYAVWLGDIETVQALIDGGADVNAKDIEEATILDIAIIRENAEVIKLLRKAGARQ